MKVTSLDISDGGNGLATGGNESGRWDSVERTRCNSLLWPMSPAVTAVAPTTADVRMKRRRSQPRGTCDGDGVLAANQRFVRVRSSNMALMIPIMAPMIGARIEAPFDPSRSLADRAPRKAKIRIALISGLGEVTLNEPAISATAINTITIPTRRAVLSLVPNQSIAKVFNQRGVRSINELPTASMGEATAPRAATNIPIVTARPPDNKPTIAPRRREGEDRSEACCCGASGSTSGLEGEEELKLIMPSI